MYWLFSILYLISFSCSTNSVRFSDSRLQKIDTIVLNWNKMTFFSLERQMVSDTLHRNVYQNRLDAIKAYQRIQNIERVDPKSTRYLFLNQLLKEKNYGKSDFMVIEANRTNESVLIRNFVIRFDSFGTANVDFYTFNGQAWDRMGGVKLKNSYRDNNLKDYYTRFTEGFNHDDIIITKFNNSRVKECEYYLYTTLSLNSNIKDVLDSFKKENFFSNSMPSD